ncbi:hypothetical protein BBK82_37005 [Lentzea guizhouensis]|uniref:N-acetyltransferase domain-containing protein n=1 Tax=Lentzea guizhouensis TaxID=1586287 RepID=A0A1B2HSS6_9PSEU|nr:GNAT family N-acetyltransferase [Lentzea guizhouensis]ANZ40763.1 hypothetical protein BBK82_37005 [Lentzea guizhouensis]
MTSALTVVRGGPADVPAILRLLDAAQDWLATLGRTGQWGTGHFSGSPAAVGRFTRLATAGTVWLAVDGARGARGDGGEAAAAGEPLGVVIIATEPEHYVALLVTSRAHLGAGVGTTLLTHARAQARAAGVGLMRVDCYDGDDHRLVAYYEKQGFTPIGTFTARNGTWPGRLLALRP